MRSTVRLATVVAGTSLLSGCVSGPAPSSGESSGERVLVFSKTAGFRHGSIPVGVAAVKELGATAGLTVDATEDAAAFTHDNLRRYDFTNADPARSLRDGHIGIQNHGSGDQVSFRNVRIKELPARLKELPVRIKKLPVQGD
ncbi:ThuA domain-containing protein [Streptomyces sp. YS415]|uniref:ThuA domain-containing protein n=1 Tax=Streptomyces sp. YS415 TaxID=2944806 RepID=UPI0035AC1E19